MNPLCPPLPLVLVPLVLCLSLAGAALPAGDQPTVKGLLFHGPDCTECADLFAFYLPGLLERHGPALEIAAIDAGQPPGQTLYQAAAARYGLAAQWNGQPTILVGEHALIGLLSIGSTLGDEFDRLRDQPAVRHWPELPGLAAALPAALDDLRSGVALAAPPPALPTDGPSGPVPANDIANALAVVVLIGMILALGHSVHRVLRHNWTPEANTPWILITLLIGLGISAYTAYTSLADVAPMCGPVGDCAKVQSSEYSRLAGIPMGVLGLFGYGAVLATWLAGRRLAPEGGRWRWIPWSIACVSVLFSLRLTALEPFVIGATCLWCLGSAVSASLLLWLLSGETAARQSAGGGGRPGNRAS
jgi:uncharacterized membrane protein